MFEKRNISEEEAIKRACKQNGLEYIPKLKTYIVEYIDYVMSNGNTLFIVKASNKKEAIDITFKSYFKPENTKENKECGYEPYVKSDLVATEVDEFFKNKQNYICLNGVICIR